MWVTATLREVAEVQEVSFKPGQWDLDTLTAALQSHAPYVATHIHVSADGTPLDLRVRDFKLLSDSQSIDPTHPQDFSDNTHAAFVLEADLPVGLSPNELQFRQTTLRDHRYALGIAWDVTYTFRIQDIENRDLARGFIRSDLPYHFAVPSPVAGTDTSKTTEPSAGESTADRSADLPADEPTSGPLGPASVPDLEEPSEAPAIPLGTAWRDFLRHGMHHVLVGLDHLLFLAALTLVTHRFMDLMRIIALFTLAHSITVTLSVLGWVQLPAWLVEPIISASIVYVALENVFAPKRSRSAARFLVTFLFGLVHGMGFAGGFVETLQQEPPSSLAGAILAFCAGVELGHLAVGIPLFAVLAAARRSRPPTEQSGTQPPWVRWASVGVALGGCFFFWAALREAL